MYSISADSYGKASIIGPLVEVCMLLVVIFLVIYREGFYSTFFFPFAGAW